MVKPQNRCGWLNKKNRARTVDIISKPKPILPKFMQVNNYLREFLGQVVYEQLPDRSND